MAKRYYSGENMDKVDATYKMLLGGRNLGKSYNTKTKVLKYVYKTGKEFTYLRRYVLDIKNANVQRYFADLNIKELTEGTYEGIICFHSEIYFCNYDDELKPIDKKLIGYIHALSEHQRYKSQMFPNVDKTILEEFITEDGKPYLPDEPNLLQEYVSTVYRERQGEVYLIGNTLTKLCPYYSEWNLNKVNRMKAGDIDVYENTTTVLTDEGEHDIVVKIAVEMCTASNVFSKMAFGASASMIVKNEWHTKNSPMVDKDLLIRCKDLYYVYCVCDNLKFRMLLKQHNNFVFWYVVPFTKDFTNAEATRIINPIPSPNRIHTTTFKALSQKEQIAFNLLRENKIFYCNNSTGTDFAQVLKKVGF